MQLATFGGAVAEPLPVALTQILVVSGDHVTMIGKEQDVAAFRAALQIADVPQERRSGTTSINLSPLELTVEQLQQELVKCGCRVSTKRVQGKLALSGRVENVRRALRSIMQSEMSAFLENRKRVSAHLDRED